MQWLRFKTEQNGNVREGKISCTATKLVANSYLILNRWTAWRKLNFKKQALNFDKLCYQLSTLHTHDRCECLLPTCPTWLVGKTNITQQLHGNLSDISKALTEALSIMAKTLVQAFEMQMKQINCLRKYSTFPFQLVSDPFALNLYNFIFFFFGFLLIFHL